MCFKTSYSKEIKLLSGKSLKNATLLFAAVSLKREEHLKYKLIQSHWINLQKLRRKCSSIKI